MDEKPPKERDIEMGRLDSKNRSDYGLEDFFQEVCYLVHERQISDVFFYVNHNSQSQGVSVYVLLSVENHRPMFLK
jgi:hypothetical protein